MGKIFSKKVQDDIDDDNQNNVEEVRRRNSLAFYISRYSTAILNEGSMEELFKEIKIDKYPKTNGKLPNYRPSKLSKIADSIAKGSIKELRNQVFVYFKHINRSYRDLYNGNTILHLICSEGYYQMLAYLLDPLNRSGLDVVELNINQMNDRGRLPIFLCFTPSTASYCALFNGIDETGVAKGDPPSDVIDKHADWCKPGGIKSREACIKLLIQHGANINAKDFHDFTPLHYACMHGWQSTVSALIEAGADINAQTKAGRTPLMSAVVSQSKNCVKLLLNEKSRINVDLVDQEGNTALILATDLGSKGKEIVLMLLEAGCDPDKQTIKRRTALKIACEDQDVDLVNIILDFGAQRRISAFALLIGDAIDAIQQRLEEDERKAKEAEQQVEEEAEAMANRPRPQYGAEISFLLEASENVKDRKDIRSNWNVYRDKRSKKLFYYNNMTRKVTWDRPRDLKNDDKFKIKEAIYGLHFYH